MAEGRGRVRSGLDILLQHGGQRRIPAVLLFWMALVALLASLPLMGRCMDERIPIIPVLYNLMLTFGVVLPFCCAWDGRLLDGVRRGRFLESILLSGMTPEEWCDGLIRHGFEMLLRVGGPIYLLGLFAGLFVPRALVEQMLWLPVVSCLMVSVSYVHQVRASSHRGFVVEEWLVLGALAVCSGGMGWAWSRLDTWWTCFMLVVDCVLLLAVRTVILRQLGRTISPPAETPRRMTPRTHAFSRNPIAVRESMRAARRGLGGVLGLYGRRYSLMAVVFALFMWDVEPYGGHFPLLELVVFACLAWPATLWGTFSLLQDERRQFDVLQSSGLVAREYLWGWLHWCLRYRALETFGITLIVNVYAWMDMSLRATCCPSTAEEKLVCVSVFSAWGIAILIQCGVAVCVAVVASRRGKGWLPAQVRLVGGMLPSVLFSCLPLLLPFLDCPEVKSSLLAEAALGLSPAALSLACLYVAWRKALEAVEEVA